MRIVWLFALLLFVTVGYLSVRAAIGDALYTTNTLDSLRRSVALGPGNASWHALLAEHIEGSGADPDPEFIAATRLSPLDSSLWVRLGFRAETEGHYDEAEKYLMQAVTVDRKFNPRWALMSYYFRRGKVAPFWYWTSRSLEMSYGDLTPIFRLMWDMTQDENIIAPHIPGRKEFLIKYLDFLTASHPEAAGAIAKRAATSADSRDVPVVEAYCDRVLTSDPSGALQAWNVLCERKLIPFSPLAPSGNIVTNGTLAIPFLQRGFDWRTPAIEGVSIGPDDDSRGIVIRMSGTEPEDCELITQIMPVTPGRRYVLSYKYRAGNEQSMRGLTWEVSDAGDGVTIGRSEELRTGTAWATGSFVLKASGLAASAKLAFRYKRPVGATVAEGTVSLRQVAGEAAP